MPEFPVPQQKGTVGKCILCVHNTSVGKLPACVESCAMHALFIADLNADVMTNASGETYKLSKYLSENDAYRLKEELNTSPRVWYVAGHGQDLEF
jgi:molybdopterin-containing oxidoreductase family iron-sulfur binding subunit